MNIDELNGLMEWLKQLAASGMTIDIDVNINTQGNICTATIKPWLSETGKQTAEYPFPKRRGNAWILDRRIYRYIKEQGQTRTAYIKGAIPPDVGSPQNVTDSLRFLEGKGAVKRSQKGVWEVV
jgi:hypothetical protein